MSKKKNDRPLKLWKPLHHYSVLKPKKLMTRFWKQAINILHTFSEILMTGIEIGGCSRLFREYQPWRFSRKKMKTNRRQPSQIIFRSSTRANNVIVILSYSKLSFWFSADLLLIPLSWVEHCYIVILSYSKLSEWFFGDLLLIPRLCVCRLTFLINEDRRNNLWGWGLKTFSGYLTI